MTDKKELLLVFTDSRGKNLDVYIDNQHILVKAYSAATLSQMIHFAEPIINLLMPACLFIGRTCDLTVLNSSTRMISLRFTTFEEMLTHMLDVFKEK